MRDNRTNNPPLTTEESIVFLREALGLTRQGLAKKLKVSVKAVSNWESGRNPANDENRAKLDELWGDLMPPAPVKGQTRLTKLRPDDIKLIRTEEGMTRAAFAKHIGVAPSTVTNWEAGVSTPRAAKLIQLKRVRNEQMQRMETRVQPEDGQPRRKATRVRPEEVKEATKVSAKHVINKLEEFEKRVAAANRKLLMQFVAEETSMEEAQLREAVVLLLYGWNTPESTSLAAELAEHSV